MYRKTGEPLDNPLFFKIKVKDVNDNAPEFLKEEYSITIRENHNKGKCHPNKGHYWFVYDCSLLIPLSFFFLPYYICSSPWLLLKHSGV